MAEVLRIFSGPFAGKECTVITRGPQKSKLSVTVFGRPTEVELPNTEFGAPHEFQARDPLEPFVEKIAQDCAWAARERHEAWWDALEVASEDSTLWPRSEALRADLTREAEALAARLATELRGRTRGLSALEVAAHFEAHDSEYRPHRARSRECEDPERADRDWEAAARARHQRRRAAFRSHWHATVREGGSPTEWLEAAWAGAKESRDWASCRSAELAAFDRWGRPAVEAILNRDRNVGAPLHEPLRFVELSQLPPDHPWRDEPSRAPDVVERIWAPVRDRVPQLVSELTRSVRALYATESEGEWFLVYVCDVVVAGAPALSILVGGPSLGAAQIEQIDQSLPEVARHLGWSVPSDLRHFYRCHHGFGRFSTVFDPGAVLPTHQLHPLGEVMNHIAREQGFVPDGYEFDDLLGFFPDMVGNGRYFWRDGARGELRGTVDWDHETRQIDGPRTFWDFLETDALQGWLIDR